MAILDVEMGTPKIKVLSLLDGKLMIDETIYASRLAFSPVEDLLAVAGYKISLFDLDASRVLFEFDNPAPQGQLSFSPDGRLLMTSGSDGVVFVYGIPD